jgi:carboxyl-terminal processing protease
VELVGRVTAEEADGLLLDLQQNGGGLLVDAIEIASIFLGPRDVVAVKKRDGEPTLLRADAAELLYRGPLVVLTSRESAAAAEIVAAALQDYRRAPIVGDGRTFGRGTVQSMVPLPRGLGAMKVTTAAFYRPGGGSPEEVGVTSDVTLPRFAEDTYRAGPAVPVEPIPPFGGEQANAPEGPVHVVSPHIVAELRARSRTRLASSNPPVAPTPELNLREAVEILADYVTLLATPEGG